MAILQHPDDLERLAHKRAAAKLGWYIHAVVYVVVNLFILVATYGFGRGPWSVFPLVGWGVGLALHGLAVFMLSDGSSLRLHLFERERARLQRDRDRARRS